MEQSHSVIKDILNARTNDLHEKKNSNNERSPQKQQKKVQAEIVRELMVNNVEESGSKKIENLNVKVHRYLAASFLDSQVQEGCNFETESEKRS